MRKKTKRARPKNKGRGWHGAGRRHQEVEIKALGFKSVKTWKKAMKKKQKPNLSLDRKRKAKTKRKPYQPNWRGDVKGKRV